MIINQRDKPVKMTDKNTFKLKELGDSSLLSFDEAVIRPGDARLVVTVRR